MKRTSLLLLAVLFFSFQGESCTSGKTQPVVEKTQPIANKPAPAIATPEHRYFIAFYQTNDASVGSLSFRCKGFPSEKEVFEVIREANHFTPEIHIVLTNFTEFKSQSDFKEWNK